MSVCVWHHRHYCQFDARAVVGFSATMHYSSLVSTRIILLLGIRGTLCYIALHYKLFIVAKVKKLQGPLWRKSHNNVRI